MKRVLLLIVLFSFFLAGCPNKPANENTTPEENPENTTGSEEETPEYSIDFLKSKHHVSLERMEELRSNFDTRLSPAIKKAHPNNPKFVPTKYLWVELDELESYIELLKKVEQVNGKKISGIAINLGANSENDQRENYGGRLTTFFNPTYDNKNSGKIEDQIQFFISGASGESLKGEYTPIQNLNPLLDKTDIGSFSFYLQKGEISLGFDELSSVPPPW